MNNLNWLFSPHHYAVLKCKVLKHKLTSCKFMMNKIMMWILALRLPQTFQKDTQSGKKDILTVSGWPCPLAALLNNTLIKAVPSLSQPHKKLIHIASFIWDASITVLIITQQNSPIKIHPHLQTKIHSSMTMNFILHS